MVSRSLSSHGWLVSVKQVVIVVYIVKAEGFDADADADVVGSPLDWFLKFLAVAAFIVQSQNPLVN